MQFATPYGAFSKSARHEHSKKQTVQTIGIGAVS
ncbi:hypothetical protein OKW40_007582 [Paraburkholderia sp. RAU6.4a]